MEIPMELNKEAAFRLWTEQFGKTAKAVDFAGREIAKAAYNDRNSKFGWNVDHIYPQSKGGKTADHNLICCHIRTNDEKADKFPCFVSNETRFEIQKRQNHYEIIPKDSCIKADQEEETFNFFDAAQGMKFWKSCRNQPQEVFAGYVKINLGPWVNEDSFFPQFYNFISEVFDSPLIFCNTPTTDIHGYCTLNNSYRCEITVIIPDVATKQDTEDLLDNCIVLNTYASFFREKYQRKIEICCGMKCYDSPIQMSGKLIADIVNLHLPFGEKLAIDELVRSNTSVHKKISKNSIQSFYPYDYVFTKLDKDLQKYV